MNRLLLFSLTLLTLTSCQKKVDLILTHGTIYTVDQDFHRAEAMAIRDGHIVALGTTQEIMNAYRSDSIVDLKGRFVYPGFIDAHSHFFGYASDKLKCDLTGTASLAAMLDTLRSFAQTHTSGWLLGRGWDQNDWPSHEFPDKKALDSLFPDRPVFLLRIDGHAALCNSAALDQAQMNPGQVVEGGEAVTRGGALTGLLIDRAVDLVQAVIPPVTKEENARLLLEAQQDCFALGLTTVTDAGLGVDSVMLLYQLQQEGSLKIRINAMISDNPKTLAYFFKNGPLETDRLTVRSIKMYADGALGSRGALLKKPYADRPGHYGYLVKSVQAMNELADEAMEHGFQLCTHAIGDSAVRLVLTIYDNYLHQTNQRRWRIEHCQVMDPIDLKDFTRLSVIPSVQPTHATSDMYWAEQRLGSERIPTAYAYNDLLKRCDMIAFGTDFPVEKIDPMWTFIAAVTRKDKNGFPSDGFLPENKVKRKDALRAMTTWAAYASFDEKKKGSLEAGKLADFIILDRDILDVPAAELPATRLEATFLQGECVYQRQ